MTPDEIYSLRQQIVILRDALTTVANKPRSHEAVRIIRQAFDITSDCSQFTLCKSKPVAIVENGVVHLYTTLPDDTKLFIK